VSLLAHVIVTKAEAWRFLKLPDLGDDGSDADLTMEALINGATTHIESFLGRAVVSRSFTETYDGTDEVWLQLRQWPVVSLTTVVEVDPDTGATLQTLDGSMFRVDERLGRIARASSGYAFLAGAQRWTVTYEAGYSDNDGEVPEDLKLAALILISRQYRDYTHERDDIQSVSIQGQSISYVRDPLPARVQSLLKPWRVSRSAA
jgi:uncharacterized phiE125 gp8 family phage protein